MSKKCFGPILKINYRKLPKISLDFDLYELLASTNKNK